MKSFPQHLAIVFSLVLFCVPFFGQSQNCNLDYSYTNTGSNMIIMVTQNALSNDVLVSGDSLGAFMTIDDELICRLFLGFLIRGLWCYRMDRAATNFSRLGKRCE